MPRSPNDKVTISYRIPEKLRERIEEAAEVDGLNLTQEITKCVEYSLNESERVVYSYPLIRMFALALKQCEMKTGKSWTDDLATAKEFESIAYAILRVMIPLVPSEQEKGPLTRLLEMVEEDYKAANIALDVIGSSAENDELLERVRRAIEMGRGLVRSTTS